MNTNPRLRRAMLATISLVTSLIPLAASSNQAPEKQIVGEVMTVIGKANLLGDGSTEEHAIRRGDPVRTGDRIETTTGGHVHIRFIDGGLVSIRPATRLHIQEYKQDVSINRGAIRFNLEQGVVRSVTGEWGEKARDRFRLNTPVAAIGIKGTDFLVKSQGELTQASVISGAIVMSPQDGGCIGTLGPCNLQQSALLSADMSGKMLELRHASGSPPRFVPATDLEARRERTDRGSLAKSGDRPPAVSNTSLAISEKPDEKLVLNQNISVQLTDATLVAQAQRVATLNELNPAATPPDDRPLLWMRNALEWNIPANSISQRFDSAEAASRKAVVGNFFITLRRDETTRTSFTPSIGEFAFTLTNASAHYSRPGLAYDPVVVSKGQLNVDFNRAQYDTSLALTGSFGQSQFTQSGRIASDGTFLNSGTSQQIAGAFSHDSKQAGYQFEKDVGFGKVSGITLWAR